MHLFFVFFRLFCFVNIVSYQRILWPRVIVRRQRVSLSFLIACIVTASVHVGNVCMWTRPQLRIPVCISCQFRQIARRPNI